MDDRTELLEKLRIDRTAAATRAPAPGWLWPVIIIVILLLVGGGGAYWYFTADSDAVPVKTAVATALQSTQSGPAMGRTLLDASGYVVALRQAAVSANSIYKVNEVLVRAGDVVKQGQIIAKLDDSKTSAALQQSQAQVKQYAATLAAAKLAAADLHPGLLRYHQTQLKEGLVSQDTFDTTKTSADAADAAVAVAEENLAVAKASVIVNQRYQDDTVIRSPFNGVVTTQSAQPGEIVSPQFSGGGGVAKIVDMDSLEVDVDVSENFISRVHPKQPAAITLNAYPDWHIPAEVIAIVPTADRSKATVEVRVGFKEKDAACCPRWARACRSSMMPRLRLRARRAALQRQWFQPQWSYPRCRADRRGQQRRVHRPRASGSEAYRAAGSESSDGQTILSGLDAGTTVAIGDFSKLHDGAKIKITP